MSNMSILKVIKFQTSKRFLLPYITLSNGIYNIGRMPKYLMSNISQLRRKIGRIKRIKLILKRPCLY